MKEISILKFYNSVNVRSDINHLSDIYHKLDFKIIPLLISFINLFIWHVYISLKIF